jgi:hypothetical protein
MIKEKRQGLQISDFAPQSRVLVLSAVGHEVTVWFLFWERLPPLKRVAREQREMWNWQNLGSRHKLSGRCTAQTAVKCEKTAVMTSFGLKQKRT